MVNLSCVVYTSCMFILDNDKFHVKYDQVNISHNNRILIGEVATSISLNMIHKFQNFYYSKHY